MTPCPVTDKLGGKGREEGGGNNVLKLGVSYLNSLSSLLSICQELNGESPGILEGILEVDKAVTHMSSHGTFPTYGDRTRITVEMQYLEENKTVSLFNKELKRNSAMMKKNPTTQLQRRWLEAVAIGKDFTIVSPQRKGYPLPVSSESYSNS